MLAFKSVKDHPNMGTWSNSEESRMNFFKKVSLILKQIHKLRFDPPSYPSESLKNILVQWKKERAPISQEVKKEKEAFYEDRRVSSRREEEKKEDRGRGDVFFQDKRGDRRDDRREERRDNRREEEMRDDRTKGGERREERRRDDRQEERRDDKRRDDRRVGVKRKEASPVPSSPSKKARASPPKNIVNLPPPVFPVHEIQRIKFGSSVNLNVALLHPIDFNLILVGYSNQESRETKIVLFDIRLGKSIFEFTPNIKDPFTKLAWSSKGTYFSVTYDAPPYISVYQLKNNEIFVTEGWPQNALSFTEAVSDIQWFDLQVDDQERTIFFASSGGTIRGWDVLAKEPFGEFELENKTEDSISSFCLDTPTAALNVLFATTRKAVAVIFLISTPMTCATTPTLPALSIPCPHGVCSATCASSGIYYSVGKEANSLFSWDKEKQGEAKIEYTSYKGHATSLSIVGSTLVVIDSGTSIKFWDVQKSKNREVIETKSPAKGAFLSADGSYLLVLQDDKSLTVFTTTEIASKVKAMTGFHSLVEFKPMEPQKVSAFRSGHGIKMTTLQLIRSTHSSPVQRAMFLNAGDGICSIDQKGLNKQLKFLTPEISTQTEIIPDISTETRDDGLDLPSIMCLSNNDSYLLLANKTALWLYNNLSRSYIMATYTPEEGKVPRPSCATFDPSDNNMLHVGCCDGSVVIKWMGKDKELRTRCHDGIVTDIAFF
eukprot:TRINITY_DN5064_c0_g1_i1.p1 TRINITY_DN5064_c0_g1~~TRINITY_DN5064_c0_g1_i1.p1  ORF type:complete len:717 (+),score=161.56 TRINITY_DN5064_c0_g1_i1:176-2326(+)